MNFRCAFLMFLALGAGSLPAQQASPQPVPIDTILLRPNIWEATAQELEPNLKELRFEWTSSNHDIARSAVSGLAFQKQSLNEAVVSFVNGKLAEVRLLYFDRGDSGTLPEEQFRARLTEITGTLTALTGRQPTDRGRDALGAVKAEGRIWETDRTRYLLEWSVTKESRVKMIPFRGEFIRLAVRPRPSERALGAPTAVTSRDMVKSFVGPDHVERRGDGDVRLKDVPMVDQGGKGYCVVASVERVMRYYGVSVDQHELAQIANSDAARGTSMDAMLASLKRLTARLGVRVRLLYEWNARDFLKTIDGYNRAAKRGKLAPELDPGRMVDVDSCFAPNEARNLQGSPHEKRGRLREIQARGPAKYRPGCSFALVCPAWAGKGERDPASGGRSYPDHHRLQPDDRRSALQRPLGEGSRGKADAER